nr:TPA_asm: m47.6 ORF 1 [Murid betaherpesvirus 1]DBA07987.1 TPA_asm: m47.6 ORF 1 [Murid betaherpesvirus 1]
MLRVSSVSERSRSTISAPVLLRKRSRSSSSALSAAIFRSVSVNSGRATIVTISFLPVSTTECVFVYSDATLFVSE